MITTGSRNGLGRWKMHAGGKDVCFNPLPMYFVCTTPLLPPLPKPLLMNIKSPGLEEALWTYMVNKTSTLGNVNNV
jgi:hypothetical protein